MTHKQTNSRSSNIGANSQVIPISRTTSTTNATALTARNQQQEFVMIEDERSKHEQLLHRSRQFSELLVILEIHMNHVDADERQRKEALKRVQITNPEKYTEDRQVPEDAYD